MSDHELSNSGKHSSQADLEKQLNELKSVLLSDEIDFAGNGQERIQGAEKVLGLIQRVRSAQQSIQSEAQIDTPRPVQTTDDNLKLGDRNSLDFANEHPRSIGHFEIIRQLGQGGYGLVFLAHDPQLGRDVALKVPRPEVVLSPALKTRFLREAKVAATLNHPNIVPVFEVGSAGPICFIAYQLIQGDSMDQWLRQFGTKGVNDKIAAEILIKLADAVHHAHQRGVLHRDLKPANVLLENCTADHPDGQAEAGLNQCTPMITDFGMAKIVEAEHSNQFDTHATTDNAIVGTPAYMSPEQTGIQGKQVDARTDVYALGAILYQLVTGQPPFNADSVLETLEKVRHENVVSPRRFNSHLSKDLAEVCLKCLEKSPSDRYSSAFELKTDLQRFIDGQPVLARPVSSVTRIKRWYARNPMLSASITTAVVAIVAGLVATSFLWIRADRLRKQAEGRGTALAEQKRELETRTQQLLGKTNQLNQAIRGLFLEVAKSDEIKSPQAADLRQAMLVRANEFYQSLVAEKPNDDLARIGLSEALYELAKVRLYLGDPKGSLQLVQEAIENLEQASNTASPIELIKLHKFAATRLNQLGDFDRAIVETDKALAIAKSENIISGDAAGPQNKNSQIVGSLITKLAELEIRKKEYAKAYELAKDAIRLLVDSDKTDQAPLSDDERYDIALCHWIVGRAQGGLGKYEDAEASYNAAVEVLDVLSEKEMNIQCHVHLKLAICLYEKGVCHSRQHEIEQAKQCYRQAIAQFDLLPETLDIQLTRQGEFHRISYSIAVAEMLSGNFEQAEKTIIDVIERTRSSIDQLPQERSSLLDRLGDCLNLLYVVRVRWPARTNEDAETALRESIDCYQQSLQQQPGWDEPAMALVQAQTNLGNLLLRQDKPNEAREQYKTAEGQLSNFLETRPQWVKVKTAMSNLQHGYMQVNIEQNKFEQALQDCRNAQEYLAPSAPNFFLLDEAWLLAKLQKEDQACNCLRKFAETHASQPAHFHLLVGKSIAISEFDDKSIDQERFGNLAIEFLKHGLSKENGPQLRQLIASDDKLNGLLANNPQSPK